ncbi:oligosaccharide flippase family protein, partial [Acidobacteriia bacterium AH_259_A11_L15]|nr:oligosaccharide flippase family protein [Acidobacteriia bacterium AH_259_A11_L15]
MRVSLIRRVRAWARLEPHLSEVLGGASVSFFLRLVARVLSLGFNILLARLLGAEGAGVYYLALTVTTLGGVVGRLGVPNALLRFSAAHAAGEDWEGVAGLYRQGMRVATLASLLVTGLLLLGAGWIAREIFSEAALGTPLRLMSLVILPASLLVLHSHLLRGLGKIRDSLLA